MKVLFLAAGKSERLRPLTEEKTKTLLDIGGKSILDHSLESLTSKGFKDFAFISGHGSDHLELELKKQSKKHKFIYKVIYNKMYESMNNCYSVLLALKHLNESFLLVNSDVVYGRQELQGDGSVELDDFAPTIFNQDSLPNHK